jgi:hypothetical protein
MNVLTKLPRCCGQDMQIKLDLGKFIEVQCQQCKDTVYIKKEEIPKPQLLDD